MKRLLVIACVLAVVTVFCSSLILAADEAKEGKEGKKAASAEKKMRGDLIPHAESSDVKVMTENYEIETVMVNEKTRIESTVRAKLVDMEKEAEFNLPKGEVTYTIVDGKPVATRIIYTSRETWNLEPPKPKEE
jgi:hypothetical protein